MADARLVTGSLAFDGGVDSFVTPSLASAANPNGLKPNQLAWLNNATVRGGGIRPRAAFFKLSEGLPTGWFQGAYLYEPASDNPYIVAAIAGRLFRVRVDTDNSVEEITIPGDANPADPEKVWFCQAEEFLIIQDGVSQPLVWDGTTLRRIGSIPLAPGVTASLPVGTCMAYYMGRVWVANGGRFYTAGDIVGSQVSGTAAYGYRDSVLRMEEFAYGKGGGAFTVPSQAGNIRALAYSANLDTALGQGQLFIFTRKSIYSLNVPVTRTEWGAVTASNQPLQRVAQINYGTTSDRSIVPVNGDLFYQSMPSGDVRSLMLAIRYFQQWGNVGISNNLLRLQEWNDRSILRFGSGINFDNRLLMTHLPLRTAVGVAHQAISVLDFDVISTLEDRLPPVWEGMWEGLDFMQLLEGDFGGLQRGFMIVHSRASGGIEVWEMSSQYRRDNADDRITMVIETASHHWDKPFVLKELDGLELWVDKVYGLVDFELYYRPDQHACWTYWNRWQICAARNSCEDMDAVLPCDYPQQTYREQYRAMMAMPRPIPPCEETNNRPMTIGYSFQLKLVVKGWCRLRGLRMFSLEKKTEPYFNMVCAPQAEVV